jgi:hypothetical protein
MGGTPLKKAPNRNKKFSIDVILLALKGAELDPRARLEWIDSDPLGLRELLSFFFNGVAVHRMVLMETWQKIAETIKLQHPSLAEVSFKEVTEENTDSWLQEMKDKYGLEMEMESSEKTLESIYPDENPELGPVLAILTVPA